MRPNDQAKCVDQIILSHTTQSGPCCLEKRSKGEVLAPSVFSVTNEAYFRLLNMVFLKIAKLKRRGFTN